MLWSHRYTIIEHELYPDCPDDQRHVLTACDWYTPTNVTNPSGLLQVSYDPALTSGSRWTFLKNMHRANVVLWPAYAHTPTFAVIPQTYFVIEHTVTLRDNMEDDSGSDHEDGNGDGEEGDDDRNH